MKFFPYICLGDPNLAFTKQLVKKLEPYADAFEFGIPFSDPIADGPVIQDASERALNAGMNIDKAFEFIAELHREGFAKPIYLMTYYNVIFAYGLEKFTQKCNGIVVGCIIPDLPLEEQGELQKICNELAIVQFISPTTKENRIKEITTDAKGFVYVVSVAGTTGARREIPDLRKIVGTVKKYTKIPVLLGFGISKREHVEAAQGQGFDGFIVGSRIVEIYRNGSLDEVSKFAQEISGGEVNETNIYKR